MTRRLSLLALTFPAALLAACADQSINQTGGDAFTLQVQRASGTAAVESGLAQAQSYCAEHGRLFVLTGSQVGSSSYNMNFRCIAPSNVPPPPPILVSAPQPAPTPARRARARRAAATPVAEDARSGPTLRYAATLPGMDFTRPPAPWQAANANILPSFGPLTTAPLFALPSGVAPAVTEGRRMPPPDNSTMEPLPRLGAEGVPVASPARPMPAVVADPAPAPIAAQPAALPLIQAQPLPPSFNAPASSFGQAVPSATPLPGASSSLPPIAGGSGRPVALPGSASTSGFSAGSTGFTQGFR